MAIRRLVIPSRFTIRPIGFALMMVLFMLGSPPVTMHASEPISLMPSAASMSVKRADPAFDTVARDISHAWFAVPWERGGAWILHIPPRGGMLAGGSIRGAGDGDARIAAQLAAMPTNLAAWDATLYMAFAPETPKGVGGARTRPILSISMKPSPTPQLWQTTGTGQRLDPVASLPGDKALLSFMGSPWGVLALLEGDDHPDLLRLDGSEWLEVPWPESVTATPQAHWTLVPSSQAVVIAAVEADAILHWAGPLAYSNDAAWEFTRIPLPAKGSDVAFTQVGLVSQSDGYLYLARFGVESDSRHLEWWSLPILASTGQATRLADQSISQATPLGLSWLDQASARLLRLTLETQTAATTGKTATPPAPGALSRAPAPRFVLQELSAYNGRLLSEVPIKTQSPISAEDFRLLLTFLFVLAVLVLFFVLSPAEQQAPPIALPQGMSLAPPSTRFVAGVIDFVPALLAAGHWVGAWSASDVSLGTVIANGQILTLFVVSALLATLHTSACEWVFGRSLGKALAGCEVVATRFQRTAISESSAELVPVARRPRLWQAVVRNLVRWLIPPVAIEGLSTPSRRHRGDVLARTVVVIRNEPAQNLPENRE